MATIDLTSLIRRSVGFDRMMELLEERSFEEASSSYPPYNIVKNNEESYRIIMAIAGFQKDEIKVMTREGLLIIIGTARPETENWTYLHRGIAKRRFEVRFQLADFIQILGAYLEDGLLYIELTREIPENMNLRTIPVQSSKTESQKLIKHVKP